MPGNRIPSWDGGPRALKRFEVDVKRWLAGEDWWRVNYNVAARFVVRQTGAARARAELFELEDLAGDDPVMEGGEVIRPGDPAAGIKRLMAAVRELVGRTAVERKAEALEIYRICTAAPGPANASGLAHEVHDPRGA